MAIIEKTVEIGYNDQPVGKVVILYGNVTARSVDGTERLLSINSPVFPYDTIITESDGKVSIIMDDPAQSQLDIGRMSEVLIDEDIYAGVTAEDVAAAAAEVEQIQQQLLAEGFDPTIELEAPAAGGQPDAGGGHPTPDFARVTHEGEVTSGAETTGTTTDTVDPLAGIIADVEEPVNDPPTVTVTAATTFTEGSAAAGDLAFTYKGGDPDGDVTYLLTNDSGGYLEFGANPGEIVLTQAGADAINANVPITSLEAEVTVTEVGQEGLTAVDSATAAVDPVNDPPTVTVTAAATFTEGSAAAGDLVFTYEGDDPDGDITYSLTNDSGGYLEFGTNPGEIVLTQAGADAINADVPITSLEAEVTVTEVDQEGLTAVDSDTTTVDAVNDPPVAYDNEYSTTVSDATVNIVIVLDTSGSMAGDRLALAKDAVNNLINTYGDSLNKVMLVDFNSAATVHTSGGEVWMSGADAITQIDSLIADGWTDYDDAIKAVQDDYGTPPPADNTFVYFLSDGEPTSSDGSNPNTIEPGERDAWETFLGDPENNIDEVYAIGIGSGVSQTDSDLQQVAWSSEGDDNSNVILVLDENDLSGTLENIAQTVYGNVVTDGDPIDYDPEGDPLTLTEVNGAALTDDPIVLEKGTLTINPDGEFSFAPNQGATGDQVFTYTISDGDEIDTATVIIHLPPPNEPPNAVDDSYSTTIEDASVNIVLVLDTSGSMEGDRLALAKEAVENLINTYDDSLNKVMLVDFNSAATVHTSGGEVWMDATDALTQINSLIAEGWTDYDDAIKAVQDGYGTPPPADNTYVYFLSDGEPTSSDGGNPNTISDAERGEWVDFLNSENIDEVYAVGIGSGVSQTDSDLREVSWSLAGDHNNNVILVLDENDLSATLETIARTVHGNILDNDTDPDGDTLSVTEIDGHPLDGIPSTSEQFDLTGKGTLIINEDGDFSFTPDPNATGMVTIDYTIDDGHGNADFGEVSIDIASLVDPDPDDVT